MEITAETAVQAIQQAWAEDENPQAAPAQEPVAQEAPSEGQTESNQSAEKPSGLFYDVDPNSLTPELRQMFDGMQRAFTQKNQEIADQRRQFEAFGGLERVQQAVEFVDSLSDPQNLVQLHTELSQYLQESGLTKAEADAAASDAIQQSREPEESDYGFADPEVAQLQKKLQELESWKASFEEEQEQRRIELELERMDVALRSDRGYDDNDMSRIYELSYAYGANLMAAADAYDQWKQDLLSSYVNKKAEAPAPAVTPVPGQFGQKPDSFGSDFEAAHRYAKQLAIAAQNAGEFDD